MFLDRILGKTKNQCAYLPFLDVVGVVLVVGIVLVLVLVVGFFWLLLLR